MSNFKKALKLMLEKDEDGVSEFDKVIKYAHGFDKVRAKRFYKKISGLNLDAVSSILILINCNSYSVLQDAITYLEREEHE